MEGRTLHILLLRHGQTDANAAGVLQGHQPTPLNLLGIRQAHSLAERLGSFRPPVDVLISSDLPRALQTASPIATSCRLKVHVDPQWRERHFGLLEGKPVGHRELWRAASGELDPPGAEPTIEMQERVLKALLGLPGKYRKAKLIAVVTHGGVIRSALRLFMSGELPPVRKHVMPTEIPPILNCSIMQLDIRRYRSGLRWRLSCVNDSAHLREASADI